MSESPWDDDAAGAGVETHDAEKSVAMANVQEMAKTDRGNLNMYNPPFNDRPITGRDKKKFMENLSPSCYTGGNGISVFVSGGQGIGP